MAQFLIDNNTILKVGVGLNLDRIVTLIPTGTITIRDGNNNIVKTILATDPQISLKEG